jgi:AcrR family transcriptional regulator
VKRKTGPGSEDNDARAAILDAAVQLLRGGRGTNVTTDQVARKAGCAKGLVHYHFKGKDQLLAAAADRLWRERTEAWTGALSSKGPKAAIGHAWDTLVSESSGGTAASCATLGMRPEKLVVQSVGAARAEFSRRVAAALKRLLADLNLEPSVPVTELGALLVATIEGIGLQLGSGANPDELEPAWSAFWAGVLSLTRPLAA